MLDVTKQKVGQILFISESNIIHYDNLSPTLILKSFSK
jgi:hypothetical protein